MMKTVTMIGGLLLLGGCVTEPSLTAAPGQGKSYAEFQRDDATCRATPPAAAQTTAATGATYYQCMASRGEMVVANRPVGYPAYAAYPYPYAYPGYAYPYAYPYGSPYYGYGYGYPYSAAYVGPYVGLGIGIGFGRGYYGRGYHGHGGYRH